MSVLPSFPPSFPLSLTNTLARQPDVVCDLDRATVADVPERSSSTPAAAVSSPSAPISAPQAAGRAQRWPRAPCLPFACPENKQPTERRRWRPGTLREKGTGAWGGQGDGALAAEAVVEDVGPA